MTRSKLPPVLLLLCWAILGGATCPPARANTWRPAVLSDSLGSEIDAAERAAYHLFPEVQGFVSARFFTGDHDSYRFEYTYKDSVGLHQKTVGLSANAWELTKLHVSLVQQYRALGATQAPMDEAALQYRLALKYAAMARYQVSRPLLQDLAADFPGTPAAAEAGPTLVTIERLAGTTLGLHRSTGIGDRSGRTELLLFAGYYGIWAGLAVPLWAESDSPQAFAAGLMIGAPASLLIANALTKDSGISRGKALMISLGGNFGTWQGIGWSAVADAQGNAVVGAGLLSGLAGIATAVALTHTVNVTEGHAAVTSAGFLWGAWFGLVAGILGDAEDDALLASSLIGSDVLVLGGGIGARNARLSKGRMRVITLLGVVGTAFGFGVNVLAEVDDEKTGFAIAGAGSVVGLLVGANVTHNFDQGRDLASAAIAPAPDGLSLAPHLAFTRDGSGNGRLVPMLGVRARF